MPIILGIITIATRLRFTKPILIIICVEVKYQQYQSLLDGDLTEMKDVFFNSVMFYITLKMIYEKCQCQIDVYPVENIDNFFQIHC